MTCARPLPRIARRPRHAERTRSAVRAGPDPGRRDLAAPAQGAVEVGHRGFPHFDLVVDEEGRARLQQFALTLRALAGRDRVDKPPAQWSQPRLEWCAGDAVELFEDAFQGRQRQIVQEQRATAPEVVLDRGQMAQHLARVRRGIQPLAQCRVHQQGMRVGVRGVCGGPCEGGAEPNPLATDDGDRVWRQRAQRGPTTM
jgi:hypothetical protein